MLKFPPPSSPDRPAARRRRWCRPIWRLAPSAPAARGRRPSATSSAASRSRREAALLDADGAARVRQHAGIGKLVLIERMRQRHQNGGPADGGKLGHGGGAGAGHDQMRVPPCAPAGRRRTARIRPRRRVRRRSRARDRDPRRAPAARSAGASAAPREACPTAAGTISAMTCAPWLPPKTSRSKRARRLAARDRAWRRPRSPAGAPDCR